MTSVLKGQKNMKNNNSACQAKRVVVFWLLSAI